MGVTARWRLAGMMALVYAVQGAWYPLLAVHLVDLGISGRGRGWIFATLALGSIATPMVAGLVADRVLSAQRLMAVVYLLGTGLLVVLAAGLTTGAVPLFILMLAYWLLIAPTYGLSNSLAMRNLPRPVEQFGQVRLWGTVGWMVIGWIVSKVIACSGPSRPSQGAFEAFWVAAGLSMLLAAYCLTLPDTPPLASGDRKGADLDAIWDLVRRPSVTVYLIVAFGMGLTTPFVYQVMPTHLGTLGLSHSRIALAMTLGQVLEIAGLAALPRLLRAFGFRGTLAIGIGAWLVRYGTLAADPPLWLALAGMLLHGIGIACFTIAGQMFLDAEADDRRRASAQALNMVVTTGVGMFLGNLLAGELAVIFGDDFPRIFLVPCLINAALLVLWLAGFRATTNSRWQMADDRWQMIENR